MAGNQKKRELSEFQIRNLNILSHLIKYDAIDDEIVENLNASELEYFSLLEKYRILEKKVNIDEKTNLLKYKKSYLLNILKTASRVFQGGQNMEYPVSFIRIDIDDFSIFNNKYGHELGDLVLVKVADTLRENSRPTDYVIRFGGEEFDVILPATKIEGAIFFLEKIYSKMENLKIQFNDEKLKVTVSAGVSSFAYDLSKEIQIDEGEIHNKFSSIQRNADNALYEAKLLGKNRYSIYSKEKEARYAKFREQYLKLSK